MDARERERLQASAVAAALAAMSAETEPDDEALFDIGTEMGPDPAAEPDPLMGGAGAGATETDAAVMEACRVLALRGIRPSARKVRAYLKEMGGVEAEDAAVASMVKHWKAEQWKSAEVRRAFQAYCRLDAEQRAALRERIEVEEGDEPADGDDSAAFEIVARLKDGDSMTERAARRTTAWIRYHNLLDRRGPEVAEILLCERADDGGYSTIRRWVRREEP